MRYSVILACMRNIAPIAPPALLKTHSLGFGTYPETVPFAAIERGAAEKGVLIVYDGCDAAREEMM